MAEKFIESLNIATQAFQTADHMTFITFPIIKEKRLLLKILSELSMAFLNIINAILQFEFHNRRIQLYKDAKENFNTFKKIASQYEITPEQLKNIIEVIGLTEKHKKSPFEFVKEEKIMIMSDNMQTYILTIEKIKAYLLDAKDILRKVNLKIKTSVI